jgi:hypothetical protein
MWTLGRFLELSINDPALSGRLFIICGRKLGNDVDDAAGPGCSGSGAGHLRIADSTSPAS